MLSPQFHLVAQSQDGKGKEKGKREPRQNFQSQKEMDKAHYTALAIIVQHVRDCLQ